MNDFINWIADVRKVFEDELNAFLSARGLDCISRFLKSALDLEIEPLSLAIYPTSSNGSTYRKEDNGAIGRFTVQFFLNEEPTEDSALMAEAYYGALIDFINRNNFGEYSVIDESVLIRMDDAEPVNGAIFLIESRISSLNDFGW